MRAPSSLLLTFSLLAALGIIAGCDCAPDPHPTSCSRSTDCSDGRACVDGRCVARGDGGSAGDDADVELVDGAIARPRSVRIEPTDVVLEAIDGATPSQHFSAFVTFDDGTERAAIAPSFTLDRRDLGVIDEASGDFTASGTIGGTGTIGVSAMGLHASTSLRVVLRRTVIEAGVPSDVATRFEGTPTSDPARAAQLVYPLDGAVMPQNVYPADIQWLESRDGDVFHIRLEKDDVTVDAYVAHDGRRHWLADAVGWRALAQTNPDEPARIRVDRWEAASSTVIAGSEITVQFARAALTGSIYYWDIAAGRIIRINDGTADRENIIPTPPIATDGNRCIGCHSVSSSGRYMTGRLGGGENIGAVFDLTTDLSGSPAPTLWPTSVSPPSARWWFSSWSPDETRVVVSYEEGASRAMRFMDPFTGSFVTVSSPGPVPTNISHPSWSPDGRAIAYVTDMDSWGGDYRRGNIAIVPVVGPDALGSPVTIHLASSLSGASPGGLCDSYPSWTPDSRHLAFAHGPDGRSETGQSALYAMGADGSHVVRLDRAMGSVTATDSFQPRFSPFDQGGYFWLSFLSRRDYGNESVGTRGRAYQQIWVVAIRKDALDADADPSMVPYWLPGQATTSRNIAAYWAPRACRPDGESCSVGTECCGGECVPPAGGGAPVCSPPPPERCHREGETCSSDADCCGGMGLSCLGNVCVMAPG